jgi:hypothetical protein
MHSHEAVMQYRAEKEKLLNEAAAKPDDALAASSLHFIDDNLEKSVVR